MPWLKTGAGTNHAQLLLSDKGLASKEIVVSVCNSCDVSAPGPAKRSDPSLSLNIT